MTDRKITCPKCGLLKPALGAKTVHFDGRRRALCQQCYWQHKASNAAALVPVEASIEEYLVLRVKQAGGETRKARWIGHRDCPDRRVWLPYAQPCWVELKRPRGKPTPSQFREHDLMRQRGEQVFVLSTKVQIDKFIAQATALR